MYIICKNKGPDQKNYANELLKREMVLRQYSSELVTA